MNARVFCACGCGEQVRGARPSARYVHGHNTRRPVAERFRAKYEISESGCWLWIGALTPNGYPQLRLGDGHLCLAHRFSYELVNGAIPDGLQVDHTCHGADPSCPGGFSCVHRRCVNPTHLEAVTGSINQLRSYERRRKAAA